MPRRSRDVVTRAILSVLIERGAAGHHHVTHLYPNPDDREASFRWARVMLLKMQGRGLVTRVQAQRPPDAPRVGQYGEWAATAAGRALVA